MENKSELGFTISESPIPWMEDEFPVHSTSIPEIIVDTNHVTTIVIFVMSAILTITLLFMIAIFIDCRQQKLQDLKSKKPSKRLIRIKVPRIGRLVREDEASIVDRMENEPSPSSPNEIV